MKTSALSHLALLLILCVSLAACGGAAEATTTDPTPGEAAAGDPSTPPSPAPPEPISPEATATGADPTDSLLTEGDRFDIAQVMRDNRQTLTECYDASLAGWAELPADGFLVQAAFTIEADGRVAGVEIEQATERYADAEDCFMRALAAIRFPTPPEGRVVEAVYPFKIRRR